MRLLLRNDWMPEFIVHATVAIGIIAMMAVYSGIRVRILWLLLVRRA